MPKVLAGLCQSTYTSDRVRIYWTQVVRLVGAIIKFAKNFYLIAQAGLFDKFSSQITQLRRLLRFNRMLSVIKDLTAFIKKADKKKRDFFDMFFRLVMLFSDINDILLYFMQLKVIK